MEITENSNVGELVAHDYRTAAVFKQYNIDFCCNGNRTIKEACSNKQTGTDRLIEELRQVISSSNNAPIDYASWPIDLLADYIEKKHHRYVESKIQEIKPFLKKIVAVHGAQHPELAEVEALFTASAEELSMHMKKEELVLFPFIRKMTASILNGQPAPLPHFGTIQNPIRTMHHEHDTEGERFHKIAELTDQYTPPADACATYKVTFSMLKEFEEDLHLHIHLENNILFPKAIQLEQLG